MTFFRFDDHLLPADTRLVLQASALLEITEFRLFELAYRQWHDEPADPDRLERVYARYMFAEVAPGWVRRYARAVVDAAAADSLDPAAFGVEPLPEDPDRSRRGLRIVALVAGVTVVLHLIAELSARY